MSVFIFPGQGIQRKGMGKELFPHFQEQIQQADKILGYSIEALCLEDSDQQLNQTEFTQPAIYVVSYLNYLHNMQKHEAPDFFLGHSVGEYAALTAAGAISFESGLEIVKQRAKFMSHESQGALAAVIGLSKNEVQALLDNSDHTRLYIANINSPKQIVIGGLKTELTRFLAQCKDNQVRAIPLRVSGAFHTPELQQAELGFKDFLLNCHFQQPVTPVISNLTGIPHKLEEFSSNLSQHLTHPVQWVNCINYLLNHGCQSFIELGEPKILSPMIEDIKENFIAPKEEAAPSLQVQHAEKSTFNFTERSLAFCKHFNCHSPLIIGSLQGASGTEFVQALATERRLSMLDTEHLSIQELDTKLTSLNTDNNVANAFGMTLSSDKNTQALQLELAQKHNVSCIEIRNTKLLSTYISYKENNPNCRFIVHANHINQVKTFYKLADAICLDLSSPDTETEPTANLFSQTMAFKHSQDNENSPFIGIGGIAGNPYSIRSWLMSGVDFISVGSVFLLSEEAELGKEKKKQLSQLSYANYLPQPDWHYPDLGSTSYCYVLDNSVPTLNEQLQSLYLNSNAEDLAAIKQLLAQNALTADTTLELIESSQSEDDLSLMRSRLGQHISEHITPYLIAGDSSLALFNSWLQTTETTSNSLITAGQLSHLLCPSSNIIPDALERLTWN